MRELETSLSFVLSLPLDYNLIFSHLNTFARRSCILLFSYWFYLEKWGGFSVCKFVFLQCRTGFFSNICICFIQLFWIHFQEHNYLRHWIPGSSLSLIFICLSILCICRRNSAKGHNVKIELVFF
jgi:hypothetical protein